jgi:monoamine oxidase
MPVNSMSTLFPPQPCNPTDEARQFLVRFALAQRNRPEDFGYIRELTSPAQDITGIARPGEFKNYRVGVIGGGLAGLAAAFELRKSGFDITVFEALEDRIGGRIYTRYFDEAKTLYGEFGAMRFPVSHETAWCYVNLFGLDTRTFVQQNNNTFFYLRGARARTDTDGASAGCGQ